MNENISVLVADDDYNICQLIRIYLEKEGFVVRCASNGEDALKIFKENPPSVVILDIMMPKKDGLEVAKEIRRTSSIPVIMLTAKGETFDKVLGLELGADDYMVKPFEGKELVARIKAVLRRCGSNNAVASEVVFPNLVVNLTNYELKVGGELIETPPKELELLYFLSTHPNQVFTREQLLQSVWGFDYFGDSRTVDVHIKRLREKLEKHEGLWHLKTVWGVGYKFEVK